jgi:hypothetical protein
MTDQLSNWNNNFFQINDIPIGGLFQKYGWIPNFTCIAAPCPQGSTDTTFNSGQTNLTRPLLNYGTLKIINHEMYSNYNSMQVSWNKQAGPLNFLTNYTFSKALGIRAENGVGTTSDPTNLKNMYGTLPNNRTHIFNLAYTYSFPKLANANRLVKNLVNDWQVSGIVQHQSGADIQASFPNANFNYSAYIPAGTTFMGKTLPAPVPATPQDVLGSPDLTLMPKLICDPSKNLQPNQYINGACFAPFATPGQQGTYIFPTLTGPGFFNSDLSVFKNFTWGASETKKLQFRMSGYNFLNHPNRTFINADPGLNLNFDANGVLQPGGSGVP